MSIKATLILKIENPDDAEDFVEFTAEELTEDFDYLATRLPGFFKGFEEGCYQAMLKMAEEADIVEGI